MFFSVCFSRSFCCKTRARALSTILSALTTGLLSGGNNKSISGDGLDLHKHDKCYRVQKCKGNGLYLAAHPRFVEGDGLPEIW